MAKVLGVGQLVRKLGRIGDAWQAQCIKDMETGAAEMVSMVKGLAPKGETRDLTESVKFERNELKRGPGVEISEGGKDAFYAVWQEHGRDGQAAQPHFFVAWRALRRRIKSRISRGSRKAMRAAAR